MASGLMLALWLAVVLVGVVPELHRHLHQDSQNANHECLATQLTKSKVLLGADSPCAGLAQPVGLPLPFFSESVFIPVTDCPLAASRAPPCAPLSTPVAG
jgi:hypothetical protein